MSALLFSGRLSLPPSANDLVRPATMKPKNGKPRARLVKTAAAQEWIDTASLELKRQGLHQAPVSGPLQLECDFVFSTISSDATNRVKQLEDLLTGYAWHDDLQVLRAFQSKRVAAPGESPHVVFRVRLIDDAQVDFETLKRLRASTRAGATPRDDKRRRSEQRTPPERPRALDKARLSPAVYRPAPVTR